MKNKYDGKATRKKIMNEFEKTEKVDYKVLKKKTKLNYRELDKHLSMLIDDGLLKINILPMSKLEGKI